MNLPPIFEEAVQFAHEELSQRRANGAFDSAVAWKTCVNFSAVEMFVDIKWFGAGGAEVKDFAEMLKVGEHQEIIELDSKLESNSSDKTKIIEQVIRNASNTAANFDIAATIAATYMETGILMPETLAKWAAGVLRGEQKRPVRRGKFAEGTGASKYPYLGGDQNIG